MFQLTNLNATRFLIASALISIFITQCVTNTYHSEFVAANVMLHDNVFHLALNLWCFCAMLRSGVFHYITALLIALPLAVVGLTLSPHTIGCSGVIFALIGLNWRIYHCRRNIITITAALMFALLTPKLAFVAHAIPFFGGVVICYSKLWLERRKTIK